MNLSKSVMALAVLGLLAIAGLSLACLTLLLLHDKSVDAAVLVVFSNAVATAVGAVAGMLALHRDDPNGANP